jgi:Ca2+-binding EF-hand superfamily protein
MQDAKDVFNYLDSQKQGTIDLKDLGTALRCLGLNPTECEVQELQEESLNNNSRISLDEFTRLSGKCKQNCVTNKEEVLKFFRSLDKHADGYVDTKELRIALCNAGEPLQDREVDLVYKEFGVSEEGRIKIADLVEGLFKAK